MAITVVYRCTGRSAGRQDVCSFTTDDELEAMAHFEDCDHDLESTGVSTAYRDPLTCDECGCFLSRHDSLCSRWTEPDEPIDDDAPIPYVLTVRGRQTLIDLEFDDKFWPAPEPFAGKTIGAWLP